MVVEFYVGLQSSYSYSLPTLKIGDFPGLVIDMTTFDDFSAIP